MNFKKTTVNWPLDSNIIRRNSLSNTFGNVRKNRDGSPRVHQGWDFTAKVGTPCYAIADGRVVEKYVSKDYGNVLVISIGETGHFAAYAHLADFNVDMGDSVELGQCVAHSGESGNAKGMAVADQHLHFEIRTTSRPGKGLSGRISPLGVFGECPLRVAVARHDV